MGKYNRFVTITAKPIISLIIRSYADDEKKKFLNATVNRPRIILDIISACKLPQTSSYRKINSLIESGLLIPDSIVTRNYGKTVTKYVSLFENLEINIVKNEISVRAKLSDVACQAIFRMMREKIINFQGKQTVSKSKNYTALQKTPISISADTMIPFLLKEEIIRA